mgnify:CR=1 FL=1
MSFATGSGLERAVNCRASSALPRVYAESTEAATLGTAIHAYLEALAGGTPPEDALLVVAEEHRTACAELQVESLSHDLTLSAEVTLVYHPATDTARVLGRALDRDYSTVGPDEIPMTLDLVGVDLEHHRGAVKDYKSGRGAVAPARRNWQTLGGALALSRVYDLDEVDAEILFTRPGEPIRRSRHTHTTGDLMAAAHHMRIVAERAEADRDTHAAGRHVEPTEGPWCRYCPCAWSCPAKVGAIKLAAGLDTGMALTPANVGDVWTLVERGTAALKTLKSRMMSIAAEQPLLVAVDAEGTETWLGKVASEGNEKLEPNIAIAVAATVLGIEPDGMAMFQREIASFEVTKKAIEEAVRLPGRVKRGQGAKTIAAILEGVRARGGATRATREAVELYTIRKT